MCYYCVLFDMHINSVSLKMDVVLMKVKMLISTLLMSSLLTGCGGEKDNARKSTQVVAKINGEEVTIYQLNEVLSKVRVQVTEENQDEVKKKALENLIDQTLVLQAAKKVQLDRNPEVLTALEDAKRRVLVDAYVKRTLQDVAKPTIQAVEAFYNERPQIFADRSLFVYTKLTIPAEKEAIEALVEELKAVKTIDELLPILDKKGVAYKQMVEAKTSETLPAALLAPLNVLKVADVGYLKLSDGLLVIVLDKKIPQPITFEQAKASIENQLHQQNRKQAAEGLVKSLKESAQIELVGDFKAK